MISSLRSILSWRRPASPSARDDFSRDRPSSQPPNVRESSRPALSSAAANQSAPDQTTYRAAKSRTERNLARGAATLRGSAKSLARLVPWTLALTLGSAAFAVDHNNLDAGRPLSFDDAETIAFGEQAFEAGLGLGWPQRRPFGGGLDFEYLNGIALNTHVSLGIDPSLGGRSDMGSTRFSPGDLTFGAMHNFRRETERSPAFSLAGELMAPTGRGSQGVAYRLRGIMSRHAGQYGRAHLNLDLNGGSGLSSNQREFFPSATLGYTQPLGMPRTFTTTGVAELGITPGPFKGRGPLLFAGIGIRKQISPRSVIDFGLQSDLIGWNNARRDRIRLVFGYSTGF